MAKAKEVFSIGDKVKCPYCGLPGKALRVFKNGHMDVEHKVGKKKFVSESGKVLWFDSFEDGCCAEGKLGSDHWEKPKSVKEKPVPVEEEFSVEEEFTIEEEFTL